MVASFGMIVQNFRSANKMKTVKFCSVFPDNEDCGLGGKRFGGTSLLLFDWGFLLVGFFVVAVLTV